MGPAHEDFWDVISLKKTPLSKKGKGVGGHETQLG